METETKLEKVTLPTKVTIKHARRNTWLPENHDGAFRFSRTYERLIPQTNLHTGTLKTGLTLEEEEMFEKKLRLSPGTLAATNIDYWSKIYVDVKQAGGVLLPSSNILDELKYRFLLAHEEVANSKKDFDTGKAPFARYILHSEEEEVANINNKLNVKLEAYTKFSDMSETDMRNFLKVYGKNPSDNSFAFVKAAVGKVVEDEPKNFLNILADPNFKMIVFIKRSTEAGILKEQAGKYMRLGGEVIGYSLEQTINFLSNLDNQDIYLTIKSQLEANK